MFVATPQKSFAVLAALAALLSCAVVSAGTALVITDKGYSVMSVGADGSPVITPVTHVVDLRGGGGGGTPPPPVDQPPVSTNATRVKQLAEKINDPAGAAILAGTVKVLREGNLPPSAFVGDTNAFKMAFGVALVEYEKHSPGAKQRWQPFRDDFASLVNELRSKGELSTQDQCSKFLSDTQAGLESAAGGALLVEEIIKIITTLLPLILEILRMFTGG